MRRGELVRRIERVPPFVQARSDLEQLVTPAEAAVSLLDAADRIDGLRGRSVLDLGCGTGRLAIGAALLGAAPVRGVDVDGAALAVARNSARSAGVSVEFTEAPVSAHLVPAELVVMNPPFGAQRRHADRPFWNAAFDLAGLGVYAFSLAVSRTFIARQTVARNARVLEVVPVPWALGRSLPHHRRRRVELDVDLWAIRTAGEHDGTGAAGARPAGGLPGGRRGVPARSGHVRARGPDLRLAAR